MIKAAVRIAQVPDTPSSHSGVREVVIAPIYRWVLQFPDPKRSVLLTLPGNSAEERETLLDCYLDPRYAALRTDTVEDVRGPRTRAWLSTGAVESFIRRVATLRIPDGVRAGFRLPEVEEWELLWGLMRVDPFIVEEPLRSMLDQSSNLLSKAHRGLWEAKFMDRESADKTQVKAFVGAMANWIAGRDLSPADTDQLSLAGIRCRVERDEDRLDLVCLLLTLCSQNGLLNRAVFNFDSIEDAQPEDARNLLGVIHVVDRWVRMGSSPIGLLLGASVGHLGMARIKRTSPRLAGLVAKGLAWTG